jgi:Lrp/AsnC family leucine-responsive transcriptional regulator
MKFGSEHDLELDEVDLRILETLQQDCKVSLARIGEQVGLKPPSVIERIKKLEQGGVIRGYHAVLDSRRIGLDVTAFIGVVSERPAKIGELEKQASQLEGVLECHHVTGQHTLLLKVKTSSTSTLEELISEIRGIESVVRTETMVVLSTHSERTELPLSEDLVARPEAARRKNGRGTSERRLVAAGSRESRESTG